MKRVALATFTAVALLATGAFAEPPQAPTESSEKTVVTRAAKPRYANTAERWRGRPHLRAAAEAHPADITGSERVYEHLPSVNFLLEGQTGGAFAPQIGAGGLGAGF